MLLVVKKLVDMAVNRKVTHPQLQLRMDKNPMVVQVDTIKVLLELDTVDLLLLKCRALEIQCTKILEVDSFVSHVSFKTQELKLGESKGFFQGLKEKAASTFTRDTPKTNFAGPPPGAHNPPEGWSYATNRGPTSGNYAPQGGAYNPEEAYSSGYNAGGGYSRPDPQAHLQEKAYGMFDWSC